MVFSKNREDKWTPSDLTMIRHNFAISNALYNNSAIVMDQKNSLVYYSLILTLLEKLRDVVCYIFAKKQKLVKKPEVWYYDIHVCIGCKILLFLYWAALCQFYCLFSFTKKYVLCTCQSSYWQKNDQVCAKQVTFIEGTYIYKYIYFFSYITLAYKKVSEIHHQTLLHDFPKQKGIF